MTVRTKVNRRFLLRLGIVGLFCLGASGWFCYDFMIGYPQRRERGLDYVQFIEEHPDMDKLDQNNAWKKRAAERGWPTENPLYKDGKPVTVVMINGQVIWIFVAGFIGLLFVGRVVLWLGCWIEADDSGLRTSAKRKCKFRQITALNKKQWRSKGIARVLYEVDGRRGKIVLDDCNYDRDTTQTILRQVEDHIDHAKIIHGKPEPPRANATASPAGATNG